MILIVSVGYESAKRLKTECRVSPGEKVKASSVLWDIPSGGRDEKLIAAVIVTNSLTSPSFNIRYGKIKQAETPVMTLLA